MTERDEREALAEFEQARKQLLEAVDRSDNDESIQTIGNGATRRRDGRTVLGRAGIQDQR